MQHRSILCAACERKVPSVVSYQLPLTKTLAVPVIAAGGYEGPLKSFIMAKHYAYRLASIYLARLMYQRTIIQELDVDYFVAVPLHWTRLAQRGYNQVDIMATELASLCGKRVIPALKRTKRTKLQATLSKSEREDNLADAFLLTSKAAALEGKVVVLVDDLMTTGSTLRQAALLLEKVKPKKIICLVGARVI